MDWQRVTPEKMDHTGKQATGSQMALSPLSPAGDQGHGLPGPAAGSERVLQEEEPRFEKCL